MMDLALDMADDLRHRIELLEADVLRLDGELGREKLAVKTQTDEKFYWKRTAEELGRQLDELKARHAPKAKK